MAGGKVMKTVFRWMLMVGMLALLSSCAAGFWSQSYSQREASSVVDYLYPKGEPVVPDMVTHLTLPVKVGIAFAPEGGRGSVLSEEKKLELLGQVKTVFEKYPYIQKIDVIPSSYLRPGGGFENLSQIGRMFGVDVVAMVSYDQIQFDDPNALSFLYWSIAGAYVIKGDQHDTQTMVDTSVFDINSRKLLFRAPGVSAIKGTATAVAYHEVAREARSKGYEDAVQQMIPNLEKELAAFKERIKQDESVQIHHSEGYHGGGSFSWLALLMVALTGLTLLSRRQQSA